MTIEKYETQATLYDIFSCLKDEEKAVFLDSSKHSEYGKYSIAAFLPYIILTDDGKSACINGTEIPCSSMEWLREHLTQNYEKNMTRFPFVSGCIGYMTYDYGKKFVYDEYGSKNDTKNDEYTKYVDMPECMFVFYRLYLIQDEKNGDIIISYKDDEAKNWLLSMEKQNNGWKRNKITDCMLQEKSLSVNSDFDRDEYESAVEKMINYIVNGDIYVANMTRRIQIKSEMQPYDIFSVLRKSNPSPFGAYMNYGKFQVISSSPERFFEIRDKKICTRPIKGTRPRGTTADEDMRFKQELMNSDKDKSELLMIVDLERNDLSRICKPGSVKVAELFKTETFATVHHLVSTICGELMPDKTVVDAIKAMYPGGSITGAPKRRAMQIIDELEHSRRMLYTGSIGYIGFDGSCDFNIVIRTLLYQNKIYTIGTGGGITCESDPDFEYEETCQKAAAPIDCFKTAGYRQDQYIVADDGFYFGIGVFETMLVSNGMIQLQKYHMERLRHGLKVLGINNPRAEQTLLLESMHNAMREYEQQNNEMSYVLKVCVTPENIDIKARSNTYREADYKKGFALTLSPVLHNETSLFTGIKSLNYADNIFEKRRVKKSGFDEPVFVNTKGYLTEGAVSNLFAVKNGKLYTPSDACGLLPGTIRRWLIENSDITGYKVNMCKMTPDELLHSDEIFVTNALIGIMPVSRVETKEFKQHTITHFLREKLKTL